MDTLICDLDDMLERYFLNLLSDKLGGQLAQEVLEKQKRAEDYREEAKTKLLINFALI